MLSEEQPDCCEQTYLLHHLRSDSAAADAVNAGDVEMM